MGYDALSSLMVGVDVDKVEWLSSKCPACPSVEPKAVDDADGAVAGRLIQPEYKLPKSTGKCFQAVSSSDERSNTDLKFSESGRYVVKSCGVGIN